MVNNENPMQLKKVNGFTYFANLVSKLVGSPIWFAVSLSLVVIWIISGPLLNYSDSWQLVINTVTTILTFLMMSLLHSSQSKWEREIEKIQKHQERTLKRLERETTEIKSNLTSQNTNPTINKL